MASRIAQLVKNLPAMLETWVQLLGWEDSLEKEMAGARQATVHRGARVRHDLALAFFSFLYTHTHARTCTNINYTWFWRYNPL